MRNAMSMNFGVCLPNDSFRQTAWSAEVPAEEALGMTILPSNEVGKNSNTVIPELLQLYQPDGSRAV